MNVYYVVPQERQPPFLLFMEALEPKLRKKLSQQLRLLVANPALGEPHVKHFTISKYNHLFELRARSKIMVRLIYAFTPGGDIVLLTPFIKRHKRNTMQALDASIKLLAQVEDGDCQLEELNIWNNAEEECK